MTSALVVALLAPAAFLSAQQPSKPEPAINPELFAAQTRPREAHQKLAAMVGVWTFTLRYDAAALGKGEETSTLDVRPAMGGRFFIEEARTRFLGEPFEWIGIHGYDTQTKQYVSSWVDNFSTKIDQMTGAWNETTKTLTYMGEEDHPIEGKATIEWAMTVEPSRLRIEMYEGAGPKRKRVMELDARRQ